MSDDDTAAVEKAGVATLAPPVSDRRAGALGRIQAGLTPEHALALLLGLLVLVVHDVGYLLTQPFWTDESWVAATTRFPLSQLPATTSSTPFGWSLVLRLVTVSGHQISRLLPLAFAGVAVLIGYWFARRLDWRTRDMAILAGVLAAAAVLLVPAMLVRDDLKQYTADAAVALLAIAVTSGLERNWSRRALVGLSCSVWVGMLFSHTVAFVGAAAFVAVCAVQFAKRAWRPLVEALVAGAGTGVLMAVVYEVFDARAVVPGLTSYWSPYYLPLGHGLRAQLDFLTARFGDLRSYLGVGPLWLAGALYVAGVVTIFRLGRPATAVTVVIIWPVMLAVSALRKYPFLDLRTSTFLIVITIVVAAIGVAGVCVLARPLLRGAPSAALAAVALAAFVTQAQPSIRAHLIPTEDVRDQATYVGANSGPDDVIIVNLNSNWSFAYYWPTGTPARRADSAVLQGYVAYFPAQPRIIVATGRDTRGVAAAMADALAEAAQHPGARVWLIRTHVSPTEETAWHAASSSHGMTIVPVGDKGLSVVKRAR
jgi:hypothetical protein